MTLIENTKFFFFFCECIYITYQIKKCVYMCVYIIKKCVCIYMYIRVVLINILVPQLGPPKQKNLASPLLSHIPFTCSGMIQG